MSTTSDSDIRKMQEALDLPDALDTLTNADKDRERAAARHHPPGEDEDDAEGRDADARPVRPTPGL